MTNCNTSTFNHVSGKCGSGHWNRNRGRPILTYFDFPGLAEAIRLIFTIGDVSFVDRRISREDWTLKYKQYSPSKKCPFLEIDGEIIVQSAAIIHYAAKRANLVPENDLDAAFALMVQGMLLDISSELKAKVPTDLSDEQRWAKFQEVMKTNLPASLATVEAVISKSVQAETFTVGGRMSYIDVIIATSVFLWKEKMGSDLHASMFPSINKVYEKVYSHPRVQKYMANHPSMCPKTVLTYFDACGRAESVRWALSVGGTEFEDRRLTTEEWDGEKQNTPCGKLPMLEVGGKKFSESVAMLLYAAKRGNLIPRDEIKHAHGLAVVRSGEDILDILGRAWHSENVEAMMKELIRTQIPEYLVIWNQLIGQNQDAFGFVTGRRLSFADIHVANLYQLLMSRDMHVVIEDLEIKVPNAVKVYKIVRHHPAIAKWHYRTATKPRLVYFDLPGRAESIRHIFRFGNIDFEDVKVAFSDWDKFKDVSPTKQVPYLELDNEIYAETTAILKYAAERANLIPPTYKGRMTAEMIVSRWNNVLRETSAIYSQPEGPERDAIKADVVANRLPAVLAQLDILVGKSQSVEGFISDNQLTYVDFYIGHEFMHLINFKFITTEARNVYPNMAKVEKVVDKSN